MCLYPKLIKNKKYTSTKKNGGVIPVMVDERMKYVPVGCGNCLECRKQKARAWQVRLMEDIKIHKNGKFITLTFSNKSIKELYEGYTNEEGIYINGVKDYAPQLEGYAIDNEIARLAVRRFLERYRKKHGISIRHWLVTELGHTGTEHLHLHGIIWTNNKLEEIEEIWKYGWMWKGKKINNNLVNYVNEQTINYIIKYITKIDEEHKAYKSKVLTSPGIGHNYTEGIDWKKNKFKNEKTNELYRTRQGYKIALPIYWRNKIYTEQEREKLWIQRLEKEERWVCGEKVDISKEEKTYWKLLKFYQQRNKELGYGSDEWNDEEWTRTQYEKERRMLKIKERLK